MRTKQNVTNNIAINHFRTGQTLFEGQFADVKQAVEAAAEDGISLAFADLRHANLVNAQMDGIILDGAQLDEANLMGANITEASMRRVSLVNTHLHSTALCESILDSVNARGALFGGTDITGATIQRCLFDTLSALDLNYNNARHLDLNGFICDQDMLCEFSYPPRTIKGLRFPVARLDQQFIVGFRALPCLPDRPSQEFSGALYNFIATHRLLIQALVAKETQNNENTLYGT